VEDLQLDACGSRFVAAGPRRLRIECPLAGEHQVSNALTAIAALHLLEVPTEAIQEGIRRTRWPGRLECVSRKPEIVLDGAHNPSGALALARHIQRFYSGRRIWLVYGAMRDKAVTEVAGFLFPLAENVILTAPNQPRAVRPKPSAAWWTIRASRSPRTCRKLSRCSRRSRLKMRSSSPGPSTW